MNRILIVLLGLLLPTIVSAQSVDVEGNVASRVHEKQSTVVANPTSIPANGITVSVITVTLRDENGTTLPNIEVTLTSNRASDFVGHYEGSTLTTGNSYVSNSNGQVIFGTRSSTTGIATYTAVAESLVTLAEQPSVTFTAPGGTVKTDVDPDLSDLVANPTTVPADGVSITVITATLRDASNNPKPGITLTLTSSRGNVDFIGHFENSNFVAGNSFVSDENGEVKFGSRSGTAGFAVYTGVTHTNITLTKQPVVTFTALTGGEDEPPTGGGGTTADEPPGIIEQIVNFIEEQAANEITNSTLAGLGALTTIALLPSLTTSIITALLQNIPLLNFIVTGWLPIRKRNYWGTVRDRKTGVPVAGVEIGLFKVGANEPALKYRTDQTGQYGFLAEEMGDYFVQVNNPLYLAYKSQSFTISRPSQLVNLDIPLVANAAEQVKQIGKAGRYMDWVRYLNYFSVIMVSVGTIVAVYAFLAEPTAISTVVLGLYAAIWAAKLFYFIRYRYYGAVVALPAERPLPAAIIQLTGERQGIQALVHSTISDSRGRFLFIVKPAKYSMIVAKEGYEPAEAEVDESRLAQTIKLQPAVNDELLTRPTAS